MLGCVILVTTNSRLIIENLLKYGLLYNPVAFIKAAVPPAGNLPLLCCWPALLVFAGVALAIEQLGALRVHFERKVSPIPACKALYSTCNVYSTSHGVRSIASRCCTFLQPLGCT